MTSRRAKVKRGRRPSVWSSLDSLCPGCVIRTGGRETRAPTDQWLWQLDHMALFACGHIVVRPYK